MNIRKDWDIVLAAEYWNLAEAERIREAVTGEVVVKNVASIIDDEPDDEPDYDEPTLWPLWPISEDGRPPMYAECEGYQEVLDDAEYWRENCPRQFWGWMYRGFGEDFDPAWDDEQDYSPECNDWYLCQYEYQ